MDENKLRFGVGVLVISAIGIGIILTFLFGAFPSVLNRDYTLPLFFHRPRVSAPTRRSFETVCGSVASRISNCVMKAVFWSRCRWIATRTDAQFRAPYRRWEFRHRRFQIGVRLSQDRLMLAFDLRRRSRDHPTPYTDGEFLDYGTKSESLFEMQNDLQSTFDAIRSAGESIVFAAESVNQLAMEVRKCRRWNRFESR